MKTISEKTALLEKALLEKKYNRALAILVEMFAVCLSLQANSPTPHIQWLPADNDRTRISKRRSDNELICDVIRIAALESQRIPRKTGETICPKCGQTLNWSVHDTGRIFGMCESQVGCLNFME